MDLNIEAHTINTPGVVVPPVNAILPVLRQQDGWIWSELAPSMTGVAISLGGGTIDLVVAYDPHVESTQVTQTSDIVAAVQFRLRINDKTAIEALQ
jgi:hypothetical protein